MIEDSLFEEAFDEELPGDIYVDSADTDNNGIEDTYEALRDFDGDGMVDALARGMDYNQDGEIDNIETFVDIDGDGRFEIVEKMHAVNNPSSNAVSVRETYYDLDGDGRAEHVETETMRDLDGDGEEDIIDTSVEDAPWAPASPGVDVIHDPVNGYMPSAALQGTVEYLDPTMFYNINLSPQVEHFDPAAADPDSVVGDPAADMQNWEHQGHTQRCAVYSQIFVIEQLTGQNLDPNQVAHFAESQGWLNDNPDCGGTPALCLNNILDAYGIDNTLSFHSNIQALEAHLQAGDKVIVGVDADQIWFGTEASIFSPNTHANHAVEVIGIDYSNPERPMVILNDSGIENGCGEMVPLDVFERAWSTSNNEMVACRA